MSDDIIQVTGLWENIDKTGNTYYRGTMGRCAIFIFKNKNKRNDNDPDYYLNFAKVKPRESRDQNAVSNDTIGNFEMPF